MILKNTAEAFNQIFNAFYKFIYENTKTFISLYELKCKRLQREIIEEVGEEADIEIEEFIIEYFSK